MIVRTATDNIRCELALRQQSIARDVLTGDLTPIQQGRCRADSVGLFVLIATRNRQRAYFFWA